MRLVYPPPTHALLSDGQVAALRAELRRYRLMSVFKAGLLLGSVGLATTWAILALTVIRLEAAYPRSGVGIAIAAGAIAGLAAAAATAWEVRRHQADQRRRLRVLTPRARADLAAFLDADPEIFPGTRAAWESSGRPWRERERDWVRARHDAVASRQ